MLTTEETAEIMAATVEHTGYTAQSGPFLEILRRLAADGRLADIPLALQTYFGLLPAKRAFVYERVPGILANSYVPTRPEFGDPHFASKLMGMDGWPDAFMNVIGDPQRFAHAVDAIIRRAAEEKP